MNKTLVTEFTDSAL